MGTIGVFQQAKQEPLLDQAPFARIISTIMRGNAAVQADAQAKKVASEQMDANAKTTVTLKPNPAGGEPLVTLKDAPASLLNQTQGQAITDAHDAPHLAVESRIAETTTPKPTTEAPAEPIYKLVDQTVGYRVPRPSDPDIAEKLKTPDGIRSLTVEMGGRQQDADAAIRALRQGRVTVDGLREHVAAFRSKRLDAIYQTIEKPLNETQDLATKQTAADKERRDASEKDLKNFYDFAKAEHLRSFLDNDAMVSAATDAGFALTDRRKAQLANAREEAHLADLRKDKAALGTYESFDDAKAALGINLSKTREAQLHADYDAARNSYTTANKRAQRSLDLQAAELETKRSALKNITTKQDQAKDIADAIESGLQPPDLQRMYGLVGPVKAELARRKYNLTRATEDWTATQTHIKTLNGQQQTRLRQAVEAASDQLEVIEGLYNEWKAAGAISGIKVFNKAALATAKNLPGKAGATAQALEGQIALATGEFGQVLMGGNSPTDHSLQLSAKLLQGDWNEQTFKKAIAQLRIDLRIRKNSLSNSTPAGASATNSYAQHGSVTIITDPSAVLNLFNGAGAKP